MFKIMYITGVFADYLESDVQILQGLGERLRSLRLERDLSQVQLASIAGVSRGTLGAMERGELGSVLGLVQVLRGLEALHLLDSFAKPSGISPIMLVKMQGKQRKRASRHKTAGDTFLDRCGADV